MLWPVLVNSVYVYVMSCMETTL